MKIRTLLLALALVIPNLAFAENLKEATFAAGCFWCLESVFEHVPGVTKVVSGFSGGKMANPTYAQVCNGDTGHVETIEITYDADKVTYPELLTVFWKSHDPTNGAGVAPDFGPQYRPVLFYRTPEEKLAIDEGKAALEKKLGKTVATQIVPFEKFYPAEDYHQNYVKNHPDDPYVRNVSIPRLNSTGLKE